jgi:hypothetical protein
LSLAKAQIERHHKAKRKTKIDIQRETGGFSALPWRMLDSQSYLGLSAPGKSLLIELARQIGPSRPNGQLLLSMKYLRGRGFTSSDVVNRAKRELIAAGLVVEMVKGCRPNKASWYAVTWYSLAPNDPRRPYDDGMDRVFKRGMYAQEPLVNRLPGPPAGSESVPAAPSDGQEHRARAPVDGAVMLV